MKFGNDLERYKANETDKIRKDKYIIVGPEKNGQPDDRRTDHREQDPEGQKSN